MSRAAGHGACRLGKSLWLAGAVAVLVACSAPDGSDSAPNGAPDAPGPATADDMPGSAAPIHPPASGRRLTRTEYLNTVADLLGVDPEPLKKIVVADGGSSGFRNAFAALLPSATRTDAYEQAAIAIARDVPASTLLSFATCQQVAEPCTSGFVGSLGRLLYRRPITEQESPRLSALFTLAASEGDGFETGARLVLQAMLQSPAFLYRLERADRIDPATGLGRVDGYEMASRLSFLLWQAAPDAALLDAAAQGALDSVEAQVEAMLQSPKARRGLRTYFDEWLALYKLESTQRDAVQYPEYTPALAQAMREETLSFFERLVLDERASFMSAYTRQSSTFGAELAGVYGVPAPQGAQDWTADLRRGGFLTQAGVLTAHTIVDSTSIVERGLFVLRSLLCSDVPPPPAGAAQNFAMVDPTLPQRVRFEQHRVDVACGGCHSVFDPLGNPFEAYDAIGRFQSVDPHGNPIRVDGSFQLDGVEHTYQNLEEFAAILAQHPATERCVVEQWTRYAFGRALDVEDAASVEELSARFRAESHDFLGLVRALSTSPAYRYVGQDAALLPAAGQESP